MDKKINDRLRACDLLTVSSETLITYSLLRTIHHCQKLRQEHWLLPRPQTHELIWTGRHLTDEDGTDDGSHFNDSRTCIYCDIYLSNCFSLSGMLLTKPHHCFRGDRRLGRARSSESRHIRASDDGTFNLLLHCRSEREE